MRGLLWQHWASVTEVVNGVAIAEVPPQFAGLWLEALGLNHCHLSIE